MNGNLIIDFAAWAEDRAALAVYRAQELASQADKAEIIAQLQADATKIQACADQVQGMIADLNKVAS